MLKFGEGMKLIRTTLVGCNYLDLVVLVQIYVFLHRCSTLLYPVSLLIGCWDWVQGGNPLYAAVKCLSDHQGQIWRIFVKFFAKSTWHIHSLCGKFFWGSQKKIYPLKWAVFLGHRHFPRIAGPFPELRAWLMNQPLLLLLIISAHNWIV